MRSAANVLCLPVLRTRDIWVRETVGTEDELIDEPRAERRIAVVKEVLAARYSRATVADPATQVVVLRRLVLVEIPKKSQGKNTHRERTEEFKRAVTAQSAIAKDDDKAVVSR